MKPLIKSYKGNLLLTLLKTKPAYTKPLEATILRVEIQIKEKCFFREYDGIDSWGCTLHSKNIQYVSILNCNKNSTRFQKKLFCMSSYQRLHFSFIFILFIF
jgi:hypothetical protein